MFAFGRDFTFSFTPMVDDEELTDIPAHTAELFVYDTKPSRDQVEAETGHIQALTTSWQAGASTGSWTVDGIDDPNPSSGEHEKEYWAGMKIQLDADEDPQVFVTQFILARAGGQNAPLRVFGDDLVELWSDTPAFFGSDEQRKAIDSEMTMMKALLRARGYQWATIHRTDQLRTCLAYAALASLCEGHVEGVDDKWDVFGKRFRARSKTLYDAIVGSLPVDIDKDGTPDAKLPSRGYATLVR